MRRTRPEWQSISSSHASSGGQKPPDLFDYAGDLFLISKRNHKELVALADANNSICKKPYPVEKRVRPDEKAQRQATHGCAAECGCDQGRACGNTERAEQWGAYV